MNTEKNKQVDRKQYWTNLVLAGLTAQVGCVTLVIVAAAVLGGLWLDAQYQTKPFFTFVLLVASIPVSLVLMVVISRLAVERIKTGSEKRAIDRTKEDGLYRKET